MREIPILFSTPMVQAILDGRKTMTRRVVGEDKRGEWTAFNDVRKNSEYGASVPCYLNREISIDDKSRNIMYPKYDVGDILWVRETWARLNDDYHPDDKGSIYVYKADHITGNDGPDLIKWKPSIFMPRAAARIFLRVTDVRVERLQEILCGDMKREGCIPPTVTGGQYQQWQRDYWIPLWDAINAKRGYGWETNPWVWVIEFKKVTPCP